MTRIGEYLQTRAINRAELSRKTGISTSRLQQLSTNPRTRFTLDEFYLIGLAIKVDITEMLHELCDGLELKDKE